jgi:hypothetical protein
VRARSHDGGHHRLGHARGARTEHLGPSRVGLGWGWLPSACWACRKPLGAGRVPRGRLGGRSLRASTKHLSARRSGRPTRCRGLSAHYVGANGDIRRKRRSRCSAGRRAKNLSRAGCAWAGGKRRRGTEGLRPCLGRRRATKYLGAPGGNGGFAGRTGRYRASPEDLGLLGVRRGSRGPFSEDLSLQGGVWRGLGAEHRGLTSCARRRGWMSGVVGSEGWRRRGPRWANSSGSGSAKDLGARSSRRLGWARRRRRISRRGRRFTGTVSNKDMPAPSALDWSTAGGHQPVIECIVRLALRAADLHDTWPYHASGREQRGRSSAGGCPVRHPPPPPKALGLRPVPVSRGLPCWRWCPDQRPCVGCAPRVPCTSHARRSSL